MAITEKGFSLQGIWERALSGHRPSQVYMILSVLAFLLAVSAQVVILVQNNDQKARVAAASLAPPESSAPGNLQVGPATKA